MKEFQTKLLLSRTRSMKKEPIRVVDDEATKRKQEAEDKKAQEKGEEAKQVGGYSRVCFHARKVELMPHFWTSGLFMLGPSLSCDQPLSHTSPHGLTGGARDEDRLQGGVGLAR